MTPDDRPLPAGLRERVLQATCAARAAGSSLPDVERISPAEAFVRAANAFDAALLALTVQQWHVPVLRSLDVQGLVGHLIGVEHDVQRSLAGDPAVSDSDHVRSTQAQAEQQAGRPPDATRAEWRAAAARTAGLAAAYEDLDTELGLHGLRISLGGLLVLRAFELWTHENDIRRATGQAPSVPDPSTLRLMTALAARALPVGADRIGLGEPTSVRMVLTGTGGGTWDVDLGAGAEEPVAIRIVGSAVDFCRLAANRATPAELELHVRGDADRAARVLAAVSALALD